ncbi:MAG TPA: D-Ala-D-Ala carboxypeptidase family metallohydrolase [Paracoccaceae bacterium]|nr:D-Ala-D-Ala carboxypeptidase family metallohydrolase [Paracoccaceae bacterium]HMO71100.1 D-Ala-D-Ala carboxypeptidase family metallohydrolase [Paracoccaceae bacterium]
MTDTLEWRHWRDVDLAGWRWPNFPPEELACRRTGRLMVHVPSLNLLQELRRRLGRPMMLNSAYRSPEHNAAVDGARNSWHLKGRAFDVRMINHDPHAFEQLAREVGFNGIGIYARSGFIHLDTRPGLFWRALQEGAEFPRRDTRFAPETRPAPVAEAAREVTPVIGVGAGIEAVVTAAEPALREIAPWLPDSLKGWAIGAAALAGVVVIALRLWQRHRRSRAEGAAA